MTLSEVVSDRASWIKGPPAVCSLPPKYTVRPWRLILLGAPGIGKGTQAQLLGQKLCTCHLSTGDVFRHVAKTKPESLPDTLADAARRMARGELVSDETVLAIVRERLKCLQCRGGFVLDGFPRTLAQAWSLDAILIEHHVGIDAVLDYRLPTPAVVARLSGRRTCPTCQLSYHVATRPPKTPDRCDQCNGPLILRDDDRPDAIRTRMETYESTAAPVTRYYESKNLLIPIDAAGDAADVLKRTILALKKHAKYPNLKA